MVSFREGLSTQDAVLLLKEEVLPNIAKGSEHIIMALDLKRAFGNMSHYAIFKSSLTYIAEKEFTTM